MQQCTNAPMHQWPKDPTATRGSHKQPPYWKWLHAHNHPERSLFNSKDDSMARNSVAALISDAAVRERIP